MPPTTYPHPEERSKSASRRTQDEGATGYRDETVKTAPHPLRRAMDTLYYACAIIAGSALVLISLVVPWGVYTRYVLDSASSWPEPMAVLLSTVLTFFGAAVCYRSGVHMRVTVVRDLLPAGAGRAVDLIAEGLMIVVGLFMVIWGGRLVAATWQQVIAEFPFLSVGVTYLPIPIGGAVTLLFIAERMLIGPPPQRTD
jgi:TRAP-type C4-dicarboxylate transport system permease small subunit